MTTIQVREIDVRDEQELRRWWETGRAAAADRLFDSYPPWELSRDALAKQHPDSTRALMAAFDGDEMVGIGVVSAPLKDNLHMIDAEVDVPVDLRRRGIGSRLLTELEVWAAALGRTTVLSQTFAPPGRPSPGELFAVARGYVVAHREGFKVLDLAEHASGWTALDAQVAERAGDYRIVEWGDHAPDELVDDLCAALSRFMSMIPLGDLELEDADVTPERLRANEQHAVEVGYRSFCSAALDASGALVAYSDLRVAKARTTQASVGRHDGAPRAPRSPVGTGDQAGNPPGVAASVSRVRGGPHRQRRRQRAHERRQRADGLSAGGGHRGAAEAVVNPPGQSLRRRT